MLAINQKYHKIHSIVIHYRKKNVFTQKSNINRRVLFPKSYCIVITTTNQYQSSVLSRISISTWSLLILLHQIILARQLRDNSKRLFDSLRILCQFNRLKNRLFVNISQYTEVTKPSFGLLF